jgi:hypothetical protein
MIRERSSLFRYTYIACLVRFLLHPYIQALSGFHPQATQRLQVRMQSSSLVILFHMTSEDETHGEFRNVVNEFGLHIVQNPPQIQETILV